MRRVSTEQIRAARALLRLDQMELATAAGIGIATVKRLEGRAGPIGGLPETRAAIQAALEAQGVEFIDGDADGGGPGVRLRSPVSS